MGRLQRGHSRGGATLSPDFLLEILQSFWKTAKSSSPGVGSRSGCWRDAGSSLEALLKFAAPGGASQGGAAAWGFSGTQSANAG